MHCLQTMNLVSLYVGIYNYVNNLYRYRINYICT